MKNADLAEIFYEMADILDMQDVQWKPQAYRAAARVIETMPDDVEKLYKEGGVKRLEEIPSIGHNISRKIEEFIKTGKVKEHTRLKKSIPAHVGVLVKIPSIGPKKVKKLNKLLKISTVAQLEKAARAHKIAALPGFGKKSEEDILDGIVLMKKAKGRIPLKEAQKLAQRILTQMKKVKEVQKIEAAGSLRRKRPTIGDIDILVSSTNQEKIVEAFVKLRGIQKVLAKGPTKATIVLQEGVQVDLRVVAPKSWGAALLYFTGNKTYNIEFRRIAIRNGWKLNEYGLFDNKTGKMIAGKTEREVCKKLEVPYLKPEQRER